ncbi:Gfo/Idh/MocA family oxidoreductase [bacterium AH-315-E10]|nr:Gfo/Idh/MocA family oxidoreductase [bacterium AH-315-E10]
MKNVAIIGYGFAGKCFHAYLVSLADGLNVYAIVTSSKDRQKDAAESYPDAVIYDHVDQALDDEKVDLLVLATPHDVHAELTINAAEKGKHIVTDKIMSMTAAEADAMIAAAKENNVMLSIFHNRRWDWDYTTVKKVIDDGLLGDPYLYQVAIMGYGCPGSWRGVKSQSGGILFDWPAHFVDQALQLVQSPVKSVFCDIHYSDHWDTDIGNYVNLLIMFENGVRYQIEHSNLATSSKPRWYILGTKGSMVKTGIDPQEPAMIQGHIEKAEQKEEHFARVISHASGERTEHVIEPVKNSWTAYYQNISDVLNNNAELIVTPEQILEVMRVYDAAMTSSEINEVVCL